MEKIEKEEYKKIMLNILKYFDELCRKNNIHYSLIGGSLIGAIRHHGIIPWDDDIDVILSIEDYYKLIDIIEKDNHPRYKLLSSGKQKNYNLPFFKLVDTRTLLIEKQLLEPIDNYGIFIDIFCYLNTSDDRKKREKHIRKLKFYNSLLSRKAYNKKDGLIKNILRFGKNSLSKMIGYENILELHKKCMYKYGQNEKATYVFSNWPIYKIEKEVQKKENIQDYIDVNFDGIQAEVFKNYDEILRTTFDDYMILPPEEKRISHNLEAYWRN